MKQGKQFKRLWGLMLLLVAMLLPQGAWATNFISEIKIGANSNQNTAKGYLKDYSYEPIERDLNYGNGDKSWYIYLGYKTDTDASKAITGIMIVSGDYLGDEYLEGGTKTLSYDGKTWYRSPAQGAADINKGAGGDDLTIFYTRDGNTVNGGKPLVSLSVAEDRGLSGYTYAGLYKNGAFSANGSTNVGTKGAARYITYTTHTHAYTAAFNWATNGKSCTATTNCAGCGDTHSNLACTVTDAPKSGAAATCTVMGWTTYTAKVTSNGKDFSATKDVQDIAALGHIYSPGSWSWAGDGHSATCTRTCGRTGCTTNTTGHTSSKSVTLGNGITSFQRAAPTCNAMGMTRYTATATVEGTQYSATMDVIDIAALGHSYGAGSWSWADDGHSATCTRTCGRTGCYSNTPGHTSSASVTLGNGIESVKLSDPTCGVQGTTRYTAMTTVEGVQYSDTKDVDDIAATGLHTFNEETDPHHTLCTVCDHSFFRYTSSTGKAVDPWDANALKDAYYAKLDFTNTYVDGQGVMEFNGTLKTIGSTAFSYCLDFIGDLTIPNSVTSIGSSAFQGCEGFTGALTIPNSVTSIEKQAFARCSNLTGNLTIPNSVTSIGISAFAVCSNLTGNLTIPNSVTSIGWEAFTSCSGFTGIEFQSVPQIGRDAFNKVNCPKTVVLSDDSYVYTGENPYFPAVQSATYTRTGIKNQFGTLVVPFDVNGMGADYDLYTLFEMDDYNLTLIKFDGTLPAGTPVIFRLHDDLAGDYNLTLTASNTTVSGQFNEGSEANGLQLVGTYETTELDINDYFISNNQFWRVYDAWAAAWGVKVAPFRAYLKSTWAGAKASSLSIRIADEDDDVTAVETLNAITDGTAEYYDMNGRRINSLQKGVNIVKMSNGKTIKVNIK